MAAKPDLDVSLREVGVLGRYCFMLELFQIVTVKDLLASHFLLQRMIDETGAIGQTKNRRMSAEAYVKVCRVVQRYLRTGKTTEKQVPSQEEIKAACAKFREGWDASRWAHYKQLPVEVTQTPPLYYEGKQTL